MSIDRRGQPIPITPQKQKKKDREKRTQKKIVWVKVISEIGVA